MDPWQQSWKLFVPLVDVSQFFSLMEAIPKLWQTVFAFVMLSLIFISLLFTIYHQFLTLRTHARVEREHRTPSRKQDLERQVLHALRQDHQKGGSTGLYERETSNITRNRR